MNPWEVLWAIVGWIFLAFVVATAAIVVLAFLLGMWQEIRKRFSSVKGKKQAEEEALERYLVEATNVAFDLYKGEIIMSDELLRAFKSGARWGWGFHHRKR